MANTTFDYKVRDRAGSILEGTLEGAMASSSSWRSSGRWATSPSP